MEKRFISRKKHTSSSPTYNKTMLIFVAPFSGWEEWREVLKRGSLDFFFAQTETIHVRTYDASLNGTAHFYARAK